MKQRLVMLLAVLLLVPATAAVADNGLVTKPSAHSAKATLDRLAKVGVRQYRRQKASNVNGFSDDAATAYAVPRT